MRPSFRADARPPGQRPPTVIRQALQNSDRALARQAVLIARYQARKARTDMRDWAQARRERTRHMIELGGLVQKAGLVDLTADDRATLLGALLDLANQLQGGGSANPADLKTRWRRAGLRAFDSDKAEGNAPDSRRRFKRDAEQLIKR